MRLDLMQALGLAVLALALVACGNSGAPAGDRAPSPSALAEPPPKALGAQAASERPLDGGNVGSLPDPPEDTDADPLAPLPSALPAPAEPGSGVAL